MSTIQTRQGRDREASYSSNHSFNDYDTDEIRRRWRIKPTERARSLTKDEAREIIERQSLTDSYTGYTYGDSISYRTDGALEYLHPHLNRRKYVDFGAGGDVTNYQLIGTRLRPKTVPIYNRVSNWVHENGFGWLSAFFLTLFRFLLTIVQGIATFGMFIGSLVYAGQQKVSAYVSRGLLTTPTTFRSIKRNRMHVSFTSPEVEQPISFRQTSTPITSTPAPSILTPPSEQKKSFIEPLHIYAWNGINYVLGGAKDIKNSVLGFTQETAHSTYSWLTDRFNNEPQTPHKRRGRPPKNAQVHESRLAPLKTAISDSASWSMDKLKSASEFLIYLSWWSINQVTSTASYIQNKYNSAHKVRNWWPLFFLTLLLFTFALYGVYNRINNDRYISTAIYQDGKVVRQWAKSSILNAYNSLPTVSGVFGFVAERVKSFFGDVYQYIASFGFVVERIKSFFSDVYQYITSFGFAVERIKSFFSDGYQYITSFVAERVKSLFSYVYQCFTSLSFVVQRIKSFISDVYQYFTSFVVERIKSFFSDVYQYLPSFGFVVERTKSFFSDVYQYFTSFDISSSLYLGFQTIRQGIVSVILSAYNWLPNFSEFFYVIGEQVNRYVLVIRQVFVDTYHSAINWVYRPSVVDHPDDPAPIREKVIERLVIREGKSGLDLSEVEKLIKEQISLYDADKTGQPDYALESSGGSVVGIGCTKVYEETSRLQSIFGISLYFSNYGARTVIQRRANSPTAGECWAYEGGHGQLQIQLSHQINVKSVSYEHLSPRLSPEGHMKTAPKDFRVWSIQNHKKSDERKHLLGEFVYLDDGEALQNFAVQFPDEHLTEVIELETTTNHGSPVTCLYRFRVHGQPPIYPAEPI